MRAELSVYGPWGGIFCSNFPISVFICFRASLESSEILILRVALKNPERCSLEGPAAENRGRVRLAFPQLPDPESTPLKGSHSSSSLSWVMVRHLTLPVDKFVTRRVGVAVRFISLACSCVVEPWVALAHRLYLGLVLAADYP